MAVDIRYAVGKPIYDDGPIKIPCLNPEHRDRTPSLAVYDNGAYCFGCGLQLDELEFLTALGVKPDDLPAIKERSRQRQPYVPDRRLVPQVHAWHRTLVDRSSPRRWRIAWLQEHYGLWEETINEALVGHTGTRFSLPIWDGSRITGVRFRLDPEFNDPEVLRQTKYIQPRGQPVQLFRPAHPAGGTILVTEGEFDALVVRQFGYGAVTTTGGSGSLARLITPQVWGLHPDEIVIATDRDPPGDAAYERLCQVWQRKLPRLRWPRGKDVTEGLGYVDPYRRGSVLGFWVRDARDRAVCADD